MSFYLASFHFFVYYVVYFRLTNLYFLKLSERRGEYEWIVKKWKCDNARMSAVAQSLGTEVHIAVKGSDSY